MLPPTAAARRKGTVTPAKGKPAVSSVRNDVLKLLYSGMLLQMPLDKVKEFWTQALLPRLPGINDETALFGYLWQE